MLKKLGAAVGATAAGMLLLGGVASATTDIERGNLIEEDEFGQVGLLNLNNVEVLDNVNAVLGVCDNNINVLGVQVPVEDVANGLSVPVLSPGESEAESEAPDLCAAGGIVDASADETN